MKYAIHIIALIFFVTNSTSCKPMTKTLAERCLFVDLQGRQGLALVSTLDAFADTHKLIVNKGHPINPRYLRLSNDGEIEAELSYHIGVGPFGAQLSLFRFNDSKNLDLIDKFDTYVGEVISQKYKVTPCSSEQFPTIYR